MPAQRVDALRALTHQEISGSEHDTIRLLFLRLDRNKAHTRPLRRFTNGLRVGHVVLLSLDERLDVSWRDQSAAAGPGQAAPEARQRPLRSFERAIEGGGRGPGGNGFLVDKI